MIITNDDVYGVGKTYGNARFKSLQAEQGLLIVPDSLRQSKA